MPETAAPSALVDRPDQGAECLGGCQGARRTRLVPRKQTGRRRCPCGGQAEAVRAAACAAGALQGSAAAARQDNTRIAAALNMKAGRPRAHSG